jgi:hypothetical protein
MMNAQELKQGMYNFTGTEQWYRHSLNRYMLYTDGTQFFAENAGGGAYWFLDLVAFELFPLQEKEPFLFITLSSKDRSAVIKVADGNENIVYTKQIEFTDCPEGDWIFYLTDNVLLLTSEY